VEKAYAKQDPLERDFSPSLKKKCREKGKNKKKSMADGQKKSIKNFWEHIYALSSAERVGKKKEGKIKRKIQL